MSCGGPATPISKIQGKGDRSPLAGQKVTVEGVLTLDARMKGGFSGFYLQQADTETDGNPETSEALFVYTRKKTGTPGERLRVTGTVKEFHGLTELVEVKAIQSCGPATVPGAQILSLPGSINLESLENMRVRVTQPLTIIDSWNLARYGELTLASNDQVVPTEYLEPGPKAAKIAARNLQQRLLLDDGRGVRQPKPIPWPPGGLTGTNTVRSGDRVHEIAGILDYRFGAWRIQPERPPVFSPVNTRPIAPLRPDTQHIRVMTMNLENYFNGDGAGDGFPTTRGAPTAKAHKTQLKRLVEALQAPDPDILAITELENDGYSETSAIAQLTRALGQEWSFIATPGADGNDQIRTGLLYRHDRITAEGQPERLTTGLFSRPPIMQAFRPKGQSLSIQVVVPHLKSKSCRGATGNNQDNNDGQGCYAHRRSEAAQALVQWLEQLPTTTAHVGTLITGDLNSYYKETPLTTLKLAGFTSMVHHFHPCSAQQCDHYTFRYKGQKGSLDYALASSSLVPRVLNATTWAINADEPRALGYKTSLPGTTALPWRSSDHNPVITDIRL
ncbi:MULTISPECIES: ExeM/NucH family extracellular endonuclease [unclassified Marinobacter]|uniref:ExeM/NucH family extracellular endonuclease n=1 Tax=unclassified Marinobacter TaxID=83889 RepID=UPI0019036731|nr:MULTISPECIES: ExeM/NucH family extracellular endonuclease [unclassified Marinobacter]MBK1872435.1 ExeM/NucH family extracellular endonuclease [Marinobacter sp. 1-3A]MBK1887326.1 ExeM/NucH family extracellular endonuclease [Marinobacter sp. DY40_1A1]